MSTSFAGIAFLALLVAALVAVHVPLGDYMFHVYTSERDWRVEKLVYRADRRQPQSPAALVRLRPQRSGVLCGQRAVPVLLRVAAGQAAAAPAQPRDPDDALAGLEHRGQLRDEHQLAGVRGRVDAGSPGADGRAWPCRTSSPPRWAWPSRSPWCAASPGSRPMRSVTSGWIWSGARCASCCRSRSSAPWY